MNNKKIKDLFLKCVSLNILSTLGVSVYILIDTYFISKGMGADGLAALNLCLPVFNFINGFGLMLGMGGGSRFSMMYCRIERCETDKIFTNSAFAALLVSAVFEIIGLFFSRQFTLFLGADSHVYEIAHSYLKTILIFSPAFIFNNLLVCFMRNDFAPRLAMAGVLGGSLANVILDYVFIFRLDMGMKGAALATCLAPLISMAIMSFHFITGWNAFGLRAVPPSLKIIRNIASLGLHSLLTEVSGGIVIMVFNFVVHRLLGNTGIAAYGVIANLAIVSTAIFTGLASGVQPLLCRAHGKQNEDGMKYLLRLSISTALIFAVVFYALVFFRTKELVGIFNSESNNELRNIAEHGLRLYFLYMPFMGVNAILSVYFTSIEKPFPSQLISLLRGTLLVIPFAFIFYSLRLINGIWLTIPTAESITTMAGVVLLFFALKPHETFEYRYKPIEKKDRIYHI
ncbi:MAG: Multidrug export protein MepA [Firmicutes bacterium ADurb.BinA205]|nr:MAG: Multidrug export protein MepA [Firmicutes bacterium ADurb.BinA205]